MGIHKNEALQQRLRKVKQPAQTPLQMTDAQKAAMAGATREEQQAIRNEVLSGVDSGQKIDPRSMRRAKGSAQPAQTGTGKPKRRGMKPVKYKERNENVADLTAGILDEDNRLMRKAATTGVQMANKRGLMNSSIAAGAAMDAQAEYATDLAKTQADINATRNLENQKYRQQLDTDRRAAKYIRKQSRLDAKEEKKQSRLEGKLDRKQSKLDAKEEMKQSRLDAGLDRRQTKLEGGLTRRQTKLEGKIDARADKQLTRLQGRIDKRLLAREEKMRTKLADMEINADEKAQLSEVVMETFNQYQKSIQSYMNNPNLSAADRNALLAGAGELVQPQIDMIESMFDFDIKWLDSSFNPVTGKTKKQQEAEDKAAKEEADKTPPNTTRQPDSPYNPYGGPPNSGR